MWRHLGAGNHFLATGVEGFKFILTTGTAMPVPAGYMPSLVIGMAAANSTQAIPPCQALQSIPHNSSEVGIIIVLLQMIKKT